MQDAPSRPGMVTIALLAAALVVSCGGAPEPAATPLSQVAADDRPDLPPVVARMIEAHGGLERWRSRATVAFTEQWGDEAPRTRVTVEQGRRRAYLDVLDSNASVVWDGERAWSRDWELPLPPRFVALLNYYFVNLPWLTADPGVRLEVEEGTRTVLDDPREYETVMMTFESGVGDTPDDWYRLYIDPTTGRLHACGYVVTYDALLPEGVEHTPEHILVYEDWTAVSGLTVPTSFTIHERDGTVYASCTFTDWSFDTPFDASRMTMPADAVIDESQP